MAVDRFFKAYTTERKSTGTAYKAGDYAPAAGLFNGFLQILNDGTRAIKGSEVQDAEFILYTAYSTEHEIGDRITYSGVKYVIKADNFNDGAAGLNHHREYKCVRVSSGG
jgi:hypothetical protein